MTSCVYQLSNKIKLRVKSSPFSPRAIILLEFRATSDWSSRPRPGRSQRRGRSARSWGRTPRSLSRKSRTGTTPRWAPRPWRGAHPGPWCRRHTSATHSLVPTVIAMSNLHKKHYSSIFSISDKSNLWTHDNLSNIDRILSAYPLFLNLFLRNLEFD